MPLLQSCVSTISAKTTSTPYFLRVTWIRIARLASRAILSVELQSSTSNGFGLTAAIPITSLSPEFMLDPDCPESVKMQSSLTIHSFLFAKRLHLATCCAMELFSLGFFTVAVRAYIAQP